MRKATREFFAYINAGKRRRDSRFSVSALSVRGSQGWVLIVFWDLSVSITARWKFHSQLPEHLTEGDTVNNFPSCVAGCSGKLFFLLAKLISQQYGENEFKKLILRSVEIFLCYICWFYSEKYKDVLFCI